MIYLRNRAGRCTAVTDTQGLRTELIAYLLKCAEPVDKTALGLVVDNKFWGNQCAHALHWAALAAQALKASAGLAYTTAT